MGLNNNTGAGVAPCQGASPEGSAAEARDRIISETVLVPPWGGQVAWPTGSSQQLGVGVLSGQLEKEESS